MAIRMLISILFLPPLATRKCRIPIYSPELSFLQEDPADRDWCLPPQVLCRNRERPTCEHDSCAWVKKPKPIGTIPTTPPTQKGSVVLGLQPLFSGLVIVCDSPLKCCQSPHFWSAALPKILAGSGICPCGLKPKTVHIQGVVPSAVQPNVLLWESCSYLLVLVCFE